MKMEYRCTIQNLNPESDFLLNRLIDTFDILEEKKKLVFHTVPRAKTKYLNRIHNMFQSPYSSKRNQKSHDKLRKNKKFFNQHTFQSVVEKIFVEETSKTVCEYRTKPILSKFKKTNFSLFMVFQD
jgi:hypothetical protein